MIDVERLIVRAAQMHSFGASTDEIVETFRDEGVDRDTAFFAAKAGKVFARHQNPSDPRRFSNPWKDRLPGGRGDKLTPRDVDPQQFARGVVHEMEHTKDPRIAGEIALDHLSEDSRYYSHLETMERGYR